MSESSKAVFISYTSQDAEGARRICESLQAGGIEVWLDRSELRGGDAWDSAIRKQIKACALFLPVISANASARSEGYFRLEWKLAVDRSHLMATERAFILPLVIDGTSDQMRLRRPRPGVELDTRYLEINPSSKSASDPAVARSDLSVKAQETNEGRLGGSLPNNVLARCLV